jgi:hypothetical protein
VTTWFRPLTGPLRSEGVPAPGGMPPTWAYEPASDSYRKLTATSRKRLLGR